MSPKSSVIYRNYEAHPQACRCCGQSLSNPLARVRVEVLMRIFIDLDNVLADFNKVIANLIPITDASTKILEKGFYEGLEVMPHAKERVAELMSHPEIDLWVATKLPKLNPHAATEKLLWVAKHFRALENKVFITPDKTFLIGDILIDDDDRWDNFKGLFLKFDPVNPFVAWNKVIYYVKDKMKNSRELLILHGGMGPVGIQNNTNTMIRKLIVQSYTFATQDDDVIHQSSDDLVFEKVPANGYVTVVEHSGYDHEMARVKYCEWEDGQIVENVELDRETTERLKRVPKPY